MLDTTNRKLSLKLNNAQLSQQTEEKNNWVKKQLNNLWGENEADYFTNPSRLVNKQDSPLSKNASPTNDRHHNDHKKHQKGLYAHAIWDNIRDDSNNKLSTFDLDKELQNLNYYDRVKQTMEVLKRNRKNAITKEEEEEEINKLTKPKDMSRVKQARVYRNELELMYRSSKMNEEKVNFLITSSSFDVNDHEGKQSIVKYLPSIDLNEDQRLPKVNSSLEFMNSSVMKHKYRKQFENKQLNKTDSLDYTIVGFSPTNSRRPGLQAQNVKLKFLEEKPYRSYLDSKTDYQENNFETSMTKSNEKFDDDKNFDKKSVSSSSTIYPPLTLNALMEYKPLIKAPGYGEFENGQPKLFKLPES